MINNQPPFYAGALSYYKFTPWDLSVSYSYVELSVRLRKWKWFNTLSNVIGSYNFTNTYLWMSSKWALWFQKTSHIRKLNIWHFLEKYPWDFGRIWHDVMLLVILPHNQNAHTFCLTTKMPTYRIGQIAINWPYLLLCI